MPRGPIPIDFEVVQRRLEAGENMKQIAPDFGVGAGCLGRRRREAGYPPAPRHGRPKGRRDTRPRKLSPRWLGWIEVRRRCGDLLIDIAADLGVHISTVERLRRIEGAPPAKRGSFRPGSRHPLWSGGRILDKHGYVLVHLPAHPHSNSSGYVREHRLVMERYLGRLLSRREVVHHKDGDPANNRIENLHLYASNAEHMRAEADRHRLRPGGRLRVRRGGASLTA